MSLLLFAFLTALHGLNTVVFRCSVASVDVVSGGAGVLWLGSS